MIKDIVFLIACIIIPFGFLIIMSDVKKSIEIVKRYREKIGVSVIIVAFTGIFFINRIDFFLISILIIEYIVVLYGYKKQKINFNILAFKGLSCIIIMVAVDLVILAIYHKMFEDRGTVIEMYGSKIMLSCLLSIELVQILVIVFSETIKIKHTYRKAMMILLAIKIMEEIYWLYVYFIYDEVDITYIIMTFVVNIAVLSDYLIFIIHKSRIEEKSEQEKRADIHVNTYEYYLNMEEEHILIRKMYHDIKNSLMLITEKENNELSKTHLKENLDKIESMNKYYHTGQTSLDILLFDGKRKAEAKGIEFEAVISEGCLSFMSEADVNVIFSNAIINAIEACEKIQEGPKRIQIKAGKNLNDILIYFKNTVSTERQKGSLKTNKKDRKMHGIGLNSIQEIVEKYNGYISIVEKDFTFQLAILFSRE